MIKDQLRTNAKNINKYIIENVIHTSIRKNKIEIDLLYTIIKYFLKTKSAYFAFGDTTKHPFPDTTFGIVYSNEFVSHVKYIDETLIEQLRVQKD